MTTSRGYALRFAALSACLRERAERGGDEDQADALLVRVDLSDMIIHRTMLGTDWAASFVLPSVPPERVLAVEVVTIRLPAVGSANEAGALNGCYASSAPAPSAEDTLTLARSYSRPLLVRATSSAE